MSVAVTVRQAKMHLSRLLEQALAGEEVIIMRSGQPIVKLTPLAAALSLRTAGGGKDDFTVPDDFDAPLPDAIVDAFNR
jgi:prevent-host-death family protein